MGSPRLDLAPSCIGGFGAFRQSQWHTCSASCSLVRAGQVSGSSGCCGQGPDHNTSPRGELDALALPGGSCGCSSQRWASFYKGAAENEGVRFLMGVGFFFVFYYGVILSIKKRRQDYEDRVKLQKAAEEERRKMESWEDEMAELEAREADEEERRRAKGGAAASPEEEALEDQRKKEADNESMKAAMRFMRSGAKVKRARRGKVSTPCCPNCVPSLSRFMLRARPWRSSHARHLACPEWRLGRETRDCSVGPSVGAAHAAAHVPGPER